MSEAKNELKIRAFLVTISTKNNVEEKVISLMQMYIEKACDYYHAVLERDQKDILHFHAIMLFPAAK